MIDWPQDQPGERRATLGDVGRNGPGLVANAEPLPEGWFRSETGTWLGNQGKRSDHLKM